MDLLSDLVIGIVSGIVSGFLVAKTLSVREQRRQVFKISARITSEWTPVPGEGSLRSLTGVRLTIVNHSDWPVRDMLTTPPGGPGAISYLGPGERRVWGLPLGSSTPGLDDAPVTLQLKDVRGHTWRWTPASGDLKPIPPKIPLHSHAVQRTARSSPRFERLLRRLPKKTSTWLWGYDSVGPEG